MLYYCNITLINNKIYDSNSFDDGGLISKFFICIS